jgi:hypothetical protein
MAAVPSLFQSKKTAGSSFLTPPLFTRREHVKSAFGVAFRRDSILPQQ